MTLAQRMIVMNGGVMEQFAHPRRGLQPPGQHVCRELHRLAAHEPPQARAGGAPDGQILGIRPEHLDMTPSPENGAWSLTADRLELLGAERLVLRPTSARSTMILRHRCDESLPAPQPAQHLLSHRPGPTGCTVSMLPHNKRIA
jgi:sn-glycerol 3-phosphate transport system ATP-binding protein